MRRLSVRALAVVSVLASSCVVVGFVGGTDLAFAAQPTLTLPGYLYVPVDTILNFTGSDPISGDNRQLKVTGLTELGSCDPSSGNNYSPAGCPRIQMSINTSVAGLLRIPGNTAITNLDADPDVDAITNSSGVVITESTDSHGLDSVLFNFNGHPDDIQTTLDKLQFVPCSQQQGTTDDKGNADPSDDTLEVDCGFVAGNGPEPAPYEEKEPLVGGGVLPTLSIQAINPDPPDAAPDVTNIQHVKIKVEGVNDPPTVTPMNANVDVPAGGNTDLMDIVDVDDPDMCNNTLCPGGSYPSDNNKTHAESDDQMLVIVWLEESNCGTFDVLGSGFFGSVGSSTLSSVHDLLRDATGLDLDSAYNNYESDHADLIADAQQLTLSTDGNAKDFTNQTDSGTVVWGGTGPIDEVQYLLDHITYHAPADDAVCHLRIELSDLGNNGMPVSAHGSPEGPELPYPGATDPDTPIDGDSNPDPGDDVPYEIPNSFAAATSIALDVHDEHPDVTISQLAPSMLGDPAGPNKPAVFQITFAQPVDPASFDESDLSLGTSDVINAAFKAGSLTPIVAGSTYTVEVIATADGSIRLTMAAGAACASGHYSGGSCESGNDSDAPTYDDNEITWDQTKPTPTITVKAGQANPTNGSSVVFEVDADETFSSAPGSFDGSDIDLTGSTATTGSPTVTWDVMNPSKFDVSVPVTSSGDVVAAVMANAYTDKALNGNEASSTATITVDKDGPTIALALAGGQSSTTSTSPINFTATFNEDVTGFDGTDVSFTGSTAGGTLVANVTGGPQMYNVSVSGMTTSGNVSISVNAGKAQDAVGNQNTASPVPATVAWVQVVDNTPPTVTIDQGAMQADPTSTSPIVFDVVFSEPVSGFITGDVTLGGTALPTTAAVVVVDASHYTVNVSGMSQSGTVTASIAANKAQDAANNQNLASTSTDGSVLYNMPVVDNTPPSVTINQGAAQADPTSASPIVFDVVFSEAVTGFATGDVTLGGTALATTADVGVVDASHYTVSVSGMSQSGTVTASIAANKAQDAAMNQNLASTSIDGSVQFNKPAGDVTPPDVTINQAGSQADPTSDPTITFTVVFSEPVTGFTNADVLLGGTAMPTSAVVTGPGPTYTVSVSGMSQSGTVTATIPANAAVDASLNPSNVSTSTDGSVQWNKPVGDVTSPTVTINQGASQADPTSFSPVVFDVVFSEPVAGFVSTDVTLGGTALPTTATIVTIDSSHYTVNVSGMSQSGTVSASIPAAAATDASLNPSMASTSSDGSVQYNMPVGDVTPPDVTINQGAAQADPTSTSPVVFDVVFSEPVAGFATGDVAFGGTALPTAAAVSTVDSSHYTVAVTGMSQSGTVTASISAGVAADASSNPSNASTSTDATVQYNQPVVDNTPPTVTIDQAVAQADPTSGPAIDFTVVFSEPVSGFTNTDVALSGTAGATTAAISGSGANYTVTVSGMTVSGTVIASIPAGAATDAALNPSTASTSTDNQVQWNEPVGDVTPPTVTINQSAAQGDPANATTIAFDVVFSEAVAGFTGTDVVVGGTAGASGAVVSGSGAAYTVTVSGMTQSGTVTASIPAGAAADAALNPSTASTSSDNSVQWYQPSLSVSSGAGNVTITASGGILTSFTSQAPQVPLPPGFMAPWGQLSFSAITTPGGLVTFTLTLPTVPTDYLKLVAGAWQSFTWNGTTGAQINGNTIAVTIQDNGRGDSDPTAGIATDPGVPVVPAVLPTVPPTAIPTPSPADLPATGTDAQGLLVRALLYLVAGVGLVLIGRRRRVPATRR